MTDLWIRNPDRAMSVLVKEGVTRISFTRQHVQRLRMNPIAYTRQFYMHSGLRPRIMLIGIQGSSEYSIMNDLDEPLAVYPTWSGKSDKLSDLISFIEKPWGENEDLCNSKSIHTSLRPVFGQKHRVIVHNPPPASSGVGKKFWHMIKRIQEDYPEVSLFANGTASYSILFGLDFKECDFGISDGMDTNQEFILPNGVFIQLKRAPDLKRLLVFEDWVKAMGYTLEEILSDQHKRYAFRIRSVKWAARHWNENFRFFGYTRNATSKEIETPEDEYEAPSSRSLVTRRKQFTIKEADKVLCNRCRIAPGCKLFRLDAICVLKESQMSELARYFQSRDAGKIIDGLATLTQMQAKRLENAIDAEAQGTESDPEVTRQLNSLFANGVKLAKLVNPELAGPGTRVQVNVGVAGNAEVVATSNPKQMVAGIVSALEQQGIPRDKITPQMIQGVLSSMAINDQRSAIEAQSIKVEEELPNLSNRVIDGKVAEPALVEQVASGRDFE